MPLASAIRDAVNAYCVRHLPSQQWFYEYFDFISEPALRSALAGEFYAARYITKLMEALGSTGAELAAHCKFQVIQYASIYEAIISHVLWSHCTGEAAFIEMVQGSEFRVVPVLSRSSQLTHNGERVYPCIKREVVTSEVSIRFDYKVDAAVAIGFVDNRYAPEIKEFYTLRNSIHLRTASKRQIQFQLDHSRRAYRRMEPFARCVRRYLTAPAGAATI